MRYEAIKRDKRRGQGRTVELLGRTNKENAKTVQRYIRLSYLSDEYLVQVLTEQPDVDGARNYWKVLKKRLKDEGNQLVTNCNQLKMKSPKDGKRYKTDVANTEQLLRIFRVYFS